MNFQGKKCFFIIYSLSLYVKFIGAVDNLLIKSVETIEKIIFFLNVTVLCAIQLKYTLTHTHFTSDPQMTSYVYSIFFY